MWLFLPFAGVAIWRGIASRQRWMCFVPLAALGAYLLISSTSANAELRMLLPVMNGMPYTLALLWKRTSDHRVSRGWIAVVASVLLLASIPEIRRPQLDASVSIAGLLQQLKEDGHERILVATDSPYALNIELVRLAKAIMGEQGRPLNVSTIVYDDIHAVDPALSLKRIDESDAVLFEQPLPSVPDFTNRRSAEYLQHAESTKMRGYAEAASDLLIYVAE